MYIVILIILRFLEKYQGIPDFFPAFPPEVMYQKHRVRELINQINICSKMI